eukprot:CAMPEP_0197177810 /NCGR_PEP_ID=MMETSP1423-20130617/3282_1 /TAXON_ID=476441 /ORGANISM="Pseudo-nitzschia heimii, Strain UNC1101" /LENGTH=87 /DNA_ID=CAMNT_0042627417 /DNA_START=859 /DNA_END=1119 /DNA_ORIENTATION=+
MQGKARQGKARQDNTKHNIQRHNRQTRPQILGFVEANVANFFLQKEIDRDPREGLHRERLRRRCENTAFGIAVWSEESDEGAGDGAN